MSFNVHFGLDKRSLALFLFTFTASLKQKIVQKVHFARDIFEFFLLRKHCSYFGDVISPKEYHSFSLKFPTRCEFFTQEKQGIHKLCWSVEKHLFLHVS